MLNSLRRPARHDLRAHFRLSHVALPLVLAPALLAGCGEPGPSAETMALGKEVYHRPASCVTCHQQGGLGVAKAFPPLRANPSMSADDPTELIKIVTHGLTGEIEVLGNTYNAPMAGLASRLTPEEIAAVLTYVRSSWRNTGGPVTVDQVVAVQDAYPGRIQPWTMAELEGGGAGGIPSGTSSATPAAALTGGSKAAATTDEPGPDNPIAWGEALYLGAGQCASCHQPHGTGIAGAYPPLANSPWVTGSTERLIKIALHGVGGEMEVLGNTYDAEMPGQGALLDDAQMAATLSYVRQAWGNTASPIYADQVKAVRDAHPERTEVWSAAVLAQADERSPLEGLGYQRFRPDPAVTLLSEVDLSALTPEAEELIDDGYIDMRDVDGMPARADHAPMVLVYEANFEVPAEDQYVFTVEATGGTILEIDGEQVLGRDTIGGNYNDAATVLLAPGNHSLRLVFGSAGARRRVALSAQADSVNRALHRWSRRGTKALQVEDPALLVVPRRDQPVVLRGRYAGQSKRGVGVGHPLRVNWAFDFERGQLTRAWRGDFVNGTARWKGRNDKYMEPAGTGVLTLGKLPPVARLSSPGDAWPADPIQKDHAGPVYRTLGSALIDGTPEFYGRWDGLVLRDAPRAEAGEGGDAPRLRRTLDAFVDTVEFRVAATSDSDAGPHLYALLAEGKTIKSQGESVYVVDNAYRVILHDIADAELRESGDRTLLIAPARWQKAAHALPDWLGVDASAKLPRARWDLTLEWID